MNPPKTCKKKTPFGFRFHSLAVFILSFSLSLPHKTLSLETCATYYCSGDESKSSGIRFPFIAGSSNNSRRCGYPGFCLTCDNQNQQPTLNLPSSGKFSVQQIDYVNQVILVTDPKNCLPKRLLNLDLAGSPFSGAESVNNTFLNCTNGESISSSPVMAVALPCLSGANFTVFVTFLESAVDELVGSGRCRAMKSVLSPKLTPLYIDYSAPDLDRAAMSLGWDVPDCGDCELRGGLCGFSGGSGLDVGCSVSVSNGTRGASKIVKYGLILGLAVPGFILMVGLTFFFGGRIRDYNQRRRQSNTEFSPSIFPQPAVIMVGLEGPMIESYPKTLLGESRRLPNPSDVLCAICLSEYEPKETLRTIPECNHYFHVQCIDEWLRLKGTCPLCRNSPGK